MTKLLAFPRDPNPYQELLYTEVRARGTTVRYLGGETPSQTLNLALLPLQMLRYRLLGYRHLHVHWTYPFQPVWAKSVHARRLMRAWFGLWLAVAAALGYRIAWTVHNALPHDPVFDDDVAARRTLVRRSDLVIVHSESARQEIERFGPLPEVRVAGLGSYGTVYPTAPSQEASRTALGVPSTARVLLFFGKIAPYKGVEDLLLSFNAAQLQDPVVLLVVGQASSAEQRVLEDLAARSTKDVRLVLTHVPDAMVPHYFSAADLVVLPFRSVTTSSSAQLALTFGRPLVLPRLPALLSLPEQAVLWYEPGDDNLTQALIAAATLAPAALEALTVAACAEAAPGWGAAASAVQHLLSPG